MNPMLTAADISAALARTLDEGKALAIVSLVEREGRPAKQMARLLVAEGGEIVGGALGEVGQLRQSEFEAAAARHALKLIADDRQEIVTLRVSDIAEPGEAARGLIDVRLLFEIARPPLELIVCGGGHVGQAVAKAGLLLNFRVTVIDDRADFASRERFPDARVRLIADDFAAALRSIKLTPSSHVVIVTRGHKHDEMCLREVIAGAARYVGMIGSRRRTTTIRAMLRRDGVSDELLRRVHAPIGLDIGAETPEEIALAILAEIVMVRRGGGGQPKSAFVRS
jgi:xanthine dehydrogenase accessory factor